MLNEMLLNQVKKTKENVMNAHNLKQMITEDIDILKSLDLEIMSSEDYYMANLKLFKTVFLRMYLTVVGTAMISILFHWSSFFSDRREVLYQILLMFGGGLLLTGFIFLFIQETLNNYVIFYHQIRSKLKSGELLNNQIRKAGWLAYKIFAVIVVVPILFLEPVCVLLAEFGAFFVSGIITGLLIEMEMKRIGVSALFTLIKCYFDKSKNEIQNSRGL